MKVIPREARRITYSTEIRNLKEELKLSNYQRQVVIGSLLGDAGLEPNWSKTNYRFAISHSLDQKDYAMWKYDVLKPWVLTEPRFREVNRSIRFRTISHPEFTVLWKEFYKDGKKIVPQNITAMLTPLTLAVWFMDDGNLWRAHGKIRGAHINSQSFHYEENLALADILKSQYGLTCFLDKNHEKFRIRISKDSVTFLKSIISEYTMPGMRYKLG